MHEATALNATLSTEVKLLNLGTGYIYLMQGRLMIFFVFISEIQKRASDSRIMFQLDFEKSFDNK